MKESQCKYKSCFINFFCFKSICIEKLASRLFMVIIIIMLMILIVNLYVLTNACINHMITFSIYIYNAIFEIILFIIGLGLFRLGLEIPVVLHKILNTITNKDASCFDEKE